MNLAREHRLHGWTIAPVGDVHHVHPCLALEELIQKVARASNACTRVGEFAGVAFAVIHQIFEGVDGDVVGDHHHIGRLSNHPNGCQVGIWIVSEFVFVDEGIDGQLGIGHHHEVMIIKGRLHKGIDPDAAVGPALVLDNNGLLQLFPQFQGQSAPQNIGRPACGIGNQ